MPKTPQHPESEIDAGPGWLGIMRQVNHYLNIIGADRDPDGKFLIGGAPVMTFMGMMDGENSEVLVPNATYYLVSGHQCNLAAGLRSTSYGIGAYVIA